MEQTKIRTVTMHTLRLGKASRITRKSGVSQIRERGDLKVT